VREPAAAADDGPVDRQQDHRTDDRGDDARGLTRIVVPAERAAKEAGDEGTCHAEKHRHDDAARILARHDQLGERAND
jgi:hypothetical protein